MIELFEKWRDRRRIRRAVRLRKRLRKLYGPSSSYSVGQVRRAAKEARLAGSTKIWTYAIYCRRDDFESPDLKGEYVALRERVDDLFFGGAAGLAGGEGLSDAHARSIDHAAGGLDGGLDGGGYDGGAGYHDGDGGSL